MKSIEKLKRLTGEDVAAKTTNQVKTVSSSSERQSQLDELRRRIDRVVAHTQNRSHAKTSEAHARGNRGLIDILEGGEIENEYGRFFLVSNIVRGTSPHGNHNIREAFDFDMSAAAMLANNPLISGYRSSDALFLDTETTGLAGGTGTMADAYSTALYVMGREAAQDFWRQNGGFDMVLITKDGQVLYTPGLADKLTETEGSGYAYACIEA